MRSIETMNLLCDLFLFWLVSTVVGSKNCIYPGNVTNQPDYYWRDYFGVIPRDAIVGGHNADGNFTYIAQIMDTSYPEIFPGNINAGQKEGVICPGEKFVDTTNVKILCANPYANLLNKFEWISTTIDESSSLIDYHWVVGGSQPSIVLYIGRVNFEGQVQVGRVYKSTSPYKGLWICTKAGRQKNFHSFELLVFPKSL